MSTAAISFGAGDGTGPGAADAGTGPEARRRLERTARLEGLLRGVRYRAVHRGLVVSLGALMRGFHFAMRRDLGIPRMDALLELEERFRDLLEQDLENVRLGYYPESLLHLPWADYAKAAPLAIADAPRILRRSLKKKHDDIPPDVERSRYPSYYLRNFHWQSDGWFSDRSASIYDLTVEVLFGGTADVMRRMAIPPLVRALGQQKAPKVLDVACGTGRFLQQLSRALPRAQLYGLDLSPHYVARARENLREVKSASFLVENAESIPLKDETFDAVVSVFLFHELPADARRNVVREAARVLKPGGTLVLVDSVQVVDSPRLEFFLDSFHKLYHEPYYKGYMRDDLEKIVAESGLAHESTGAHFVSKVVVATKPS